MAPVMLKERDEALRHILLPCNVCGRDGKAIVTFTSCAAHGCSSGELLRYTGVFAFQRLPPQFNLFLPTASQWVGIRCPLSFI